jgi:hypothetical protein
VLPPVEAPSAGFLLQLFFIPMVIVTIIVSIWAMFSWLVHLGVILGIWSKTFEP